MEYKVVLCLLFLVIAAYAEDKEEKVKAAVSVNISLFYFQCYYISRFGHYTVARRQRTLDHAK